MWAAGLCLVIGAIVLLATAAAPTPSPRQAGTQQTGPAGSAQPTQLRRAADIHSAANGPSRPRISPARPTPLRIIAAFAGRGDQVTRPFKVRTGARLEFRWSYSCPAGLPLDQLIVEDAGGHAALGASIDATGPAGSGTNWVVPSWHSHYLVVISTCSWHMKVVQS